MNKDLKEFLENFNAKKVDYLIVGGMAVAFYGYPRFTGDIDVWIRKSPENAKKIISAIDDFGYAGLELNENDLLKDNMVFQFGIEPNRIDLITDVDGLNFEKAFKNKNKGTMDGVQVFYISLEDLKINKNKLGRHKDLDDLENLQ